MTLLDSVHTAPKSIRMSFCAPIVLDAGVFAMSVDEPAGGPVVIRVCGALDPSSSRELEQCLGAAIDSGRAVVVDLLDVEHVPPSAVVTLTAAAHRLSHSRCRIAIASRPSSSLAFVDDVSISRHESLAQAITAALPRATDTLGDD